MSQQKNKKIQVFSFMFIVVEIKIFSIWCYQRSRNWLQKKSNRVVFSFPLSKMNATNILFCFIFRNVCFVSTHFKNLVICLILWDFNSAKSRLDRILVFKSMRESRYCVYHRQFLFYREFSLNTNHVKRQTLIDKVDPSKIYINISETLFLNAFSISLTD